MIFYNSLLAKWFLGKGKKHYFMLGWFFFTRYKYLEVWEDMELRIHAKQYWEAIKHSGDTLYLRKRKAYAWKKGYGKKELPVSRWND